MKKVIIGIVPTFIQNDNSLYENYDKFINVYTKKVVENNGIPIGILFDDENINYDVLELCDGFIIPGGTKVRKYVYEIIYYAIKNNKPLLGICMGAEALDIFSVIYEKMNSKETYTEKEIINIYQQLKSENDGTLLKKLEENNIHNHDYHSVNDLEQTLHNIDIDKDSIAYSIFGLDKIDVPSLHGYDFKKVGKDFRVTARSIDKVSEIIEYNDSDYFIIGVHFHPELIDTKIFERLILECKKRK